MDKEALKIELFIMNIKQKIDSIPNPFYVNVRL